MGGVGDDNNSRYANLDTYGDSDYELVANGDVINYNTTLGEPTIIYESLNLRMMLH